LKKKERAILFIYPLPSLFSARAAHSACLPSRWSPGPTRRLSPQASTARSTCSPLRLGPSGRGPVCPAQLGFTQQRPTPSLSLFSFADHAAPSVTRRLPVLVREPDSARLYPPPPPRFGVPFTPRPPLCPYKNQAAPPLFVFASNRVISILCAAKP